MQYRPDDDLGPRVEALKTTIMLNEGRRLDYRFEQEVDSLIHLFYDDIGTIKFLPLRSLFDLFLIKVLYVGRGGHDPDVLDYLSDMLMRFLWSRELVRFNQRFDFLYSLLDEIKDRRRFQNLFEASRHMADNALFVTGVFPTARPGRRRARSIPRFDRAHFIELGRRYYKLAAEEQLAELVGQRLVLSKLSERFTFYMEALSEMSERYILGFDMEVVSNKMLDAMNHYRQTGDEQYLDMARKYAALLKVDRRSPGWRRFRGARILESPPE
jgi:hypothetical protein